MEMEESTTSSSKSNCVSASLKTDAQTLDSVKFRPNFSTRKRNSHETRVADTSPSNIVQGLRGGAPMPYLTKKNVPTQKDSSDKMRQEETHMQEKNEALSSFQMECLAATAFLLGSPLQRDQPRTGEAVQLSMQLAYELLAREIDPERVIALIESRSSEINPLP